MQITVNETLKNVISKFKHYTCNQPMLEMSSIINLLWLKKGQTMLPLTYNMKNPKVTIDSHSNTIKVLHATKIAQTDPSIQTTLLMYFNI